MSVEFGIFGEEGCAVRDFYSREEAQAFLDRAAEEYEACHVGECCPDHPDHERESCEECNAESDEDEA